MNKRELQSIGRRLYGNDWQSALASAIGKHRITVWRWAQTGNIPTADAAKIWALALPKKRR